MESGFSPSEYTRRCYLISTFLVTYLESRNVSVLHPGEIFGWNEEPDIMSFLNQDGVHLNVAGERAISSILRRRICGWMNEPAGAVGTESVEDREGPTDGGVEGELEKDGYLSPFLETFNAMGRNYAFMKPGPKVAGDF